MSILETILAEAELERIQADLKSNRTMLCPVCGEPMDRPSGLAKAWFCYASGDRPEEGFPNKCLKIEDLRRTFMADAPDQIKRNGHHLDIFQGQIICAIVRDREILATFETVRGSMARTNLRWWTRADDVGVHDLPGLIDRYGLAWMGWAEKFASK